MKAYTLYSKRSVSPMGWVPPEEAGKAVKTLQGYLEYHVRIDGFDFKFRTLGEIEYCIRQFSLKNLPTDLTFHKNSSWLSRLPGWVKSWKYRKKAVAGLKGALEQFRKDPEGMARGRDPWEKQNAKFEWKFLASDLQSALRKKAARKRRSKKAQTKDR